MPSPGREPPEVRVLPADYEAAKSLGAACGVSPTLAQILLHRGYRESGPALEFLKPTLAGLTAPDSMVDRDVAAERLAEAIQRRERIVVFGDYDVDGTTAAVILGDILEALGGEVAVLCADRFLGGYGLSAEALARCLEHGPGLIVTCDCGSSDHERIRDAVTQGIDVIVVDHHLVPDEPLPALAFLNPHRPDCAFPYKGLASAGLALNLGAAVRARLDTALDVRQWLDLVALGTVADVAPLDGDNRRLVRAGLKRIASNAVRPGVAALRSIAKIPPNGFISAVDIAFKFAPRINAAGRLGQPEAALRVLRATTTEAAYEAAHALERLNLERRELSARMAEDAIAQVKDVYGPELRSGVVVASKDWHRGVVGITAARLVEHFGVPAVVVALDQSIGHGSGRTVPGMDLHGAVAQCAGEIEGWGGHRAAVGLSMQADRLDAFRAAFSDATRVPAPHLEPLVVDVRLDHAFVLPTAVEMAQLEPLGEKNPSPRFLAEGDVREVQAVGETGRHLALQLQLAGSTLRAFAPNHGHLEKSIQQRLSIFGELQPDHWRGGDHLQFLVSHLWNADAGV